MAAIYVWVHSTFCAFDNNFKYLLGTNYNMEKTQRTTMKIIPQIESMFGNKYIRK